MEDVFAEDSFVGVVDHNFTDYSDMEAERCGICMEIVIDRGVLDCCQHWFCFTCIDNWATITNLCPLCQNEFQLITCVPVYDTIGSNSADNDLESRGDDWCIEGKNNTLSFPSYYIDENAVFCLDGDGCKVRSMSESIEEYFDLDTSIACDSCDVWYHAFCVGFDPEATCDTSWLCPRCTVNSMLKNSDDILLWMPRNQHDPDNSSGECFVDASLSRKVIISVADAGETAVVVSMLEGKKGTDELNEKNSGLDVCKDPKSNSSETASVNKHTANPNLEAKNQVSEFVVDAHEKIDIGGNEGTEEKRRKSSPNCNISEDLKIDMVLTSFADNNKLKTPSNERISIESNSVAEKLELPLPQGTSFISCSNSPLSIGMNKVGSMPSVSDRSGTSANKILGQLCDNESLESGLSDDKPSNRLAEDQVSVAMQLTKKLGECPLPGKFRDFLTRKKLDADENNIDQKNYIDKISGAKRKHRDPSVSEDGQLKTNGGKVLSKKVKVDKNNQLPHFENQSDECVTVTQKSPSPVIFSEEGKLRKKSDRKNVSTSIMDIVQGTVHRSKRIPQTLEESSSGKVESAAGLRVKKIMRRSAEDKESLVLVQKLRSEIRDAVRNKTPKELGDNLFDQKLLAAFRAAVAGPIAETEKSLPVDLKAKKSLLQKGKVRESLTKKIYGIGGRRRRAWNRDCEIEFWKYRCSKYSRPEKIETLNSVLNLLRKGSGSTEIKQGDDKAASSSILSRLYLADSSVFPRKDDIKPLSTLKAAGIPLQSKEASSMGRPVSQSLDKGNFQTPCTDAIPSQIKTPSSYSKATKPSSQMEKGGSASMKLHSNKYSKGPTNSKIDGSKSNYQKEMVGKSDDNKDNRRKWAQQFLARKAAVTGKDASREQEDTAELKGNHTLLAQLPREMRPVLATSRHNKIPISIRQAQLHRLTEHFLRKANVPINGRTAEIELAVADAVNIEKEVADRSNSKLVYVNLCSQELLHRSDTTSSVRSSKSDHTSKPYPTPTSKVSTDGSVETVNDHSSCLEVNEALRNAGLLSDSPPNSPHRQMEGIDEVNTSKSLEQEGPDNVFEMFSQPELDIYGDFEYDLEDDDFIGASELKLSERNTEEPKLKVVFSTIESDKPNGARDFEVHEEELAAVGVGESSYFLENLALANTSSVTSHVNEKTINCDSQSSPPFGGEEFSLAECEELYGPDKEPLVEKFPERAPVKPNEPKNSEGSVSDPIADPSDPDRETYSKNLEITTVVRNSSDGEEEPSHSQKNSSRKEKIHKMDIRLQPDMRKQPDGCNPSVYKKVEAYIKEHIRPLCKSRVITAEQYRWAVGKTTDKIMKYHSKDANANFLIKEGEKVKKLAEQYVEAAQRTE